MRYRLRTLMILLAIAPPLLAVLLYAINAALAIYDPTNSTLATVIEP
jgi:hypothetical protein